MREWTKRHVERARAWGQSGRLLVLPMLALPLAFSLLSGCKSDGGEDVENEERCEHHSECGWKEVCGAEDVCVPAPACGVARSWSKCADYADSLRAEEGGRYVCAEKQCTRACVSDNECTESGEICSDFGTCIPYDGTVLPYDSGSLTPGDLKAGVGEALLNVPLGIEMGGYGSRAKKDDGRYARSLSASHGQMDAQYARAVVLDNGVNRLLFIRVPVVFAFSQIHDRIARNLQEETGHDWRDEIIFTATHTHSGPARFWRLPTETAIDPGMLGAGAFHQEVEDWLVDSLTEAALMAVNSMQPAKFAWKIVEAFDTDDHVGRDRWRSTPPFDMNRMLLMRVDDLDDVPLAVLFSYAAHASDNSGDYMTDDVIGGAERGLQEALGETFDRFVPALYFAENGGNMSQASGKQGHSFPYSRERAGFVLAQKSMPVLMDMVTERNIAFRSRSYRFNINYEAVGYVGSEFSAKGKRPTGGTFFNGALMCGGPLADDDDYATYIEPNKLSCLSLSMILNNFQPTPLTRSQVMAVELDGLSLITLPGEPTQEIGWQVMRLLRDRFARPTAQTWVFGYTNDHLLYIVPTNLRGEKPDVAGFLGDAPDSYPDYAFSFLQGGYEPGMAPWGPRFGDWILERVGDAFAWLQDEAAVPAYAPILPTHYTRVDSGDFERDATPDTRVGVVLEDLPATLQRMVPVTFTWVGGDAGAEAPQAPLVTLEVEDNGTWKPVIGRDRMPVTNRGHAMATRIHIDESGATPEYQWSVYWEAEKDLPVGNYRLSVQGHRYSGASKERVPYTLTSDVVAIQVNDALVVGVEFDEATWMIRGKASYPAMTTLEQNTGGERAKLSGSLRLRDPRVPTSILAPLEIGSDLEPEGISFQITQVGQPAWDCECGTCACDTTTVLTGVDGYQNVPQTTLSVEVTDKSSSLQSVVLTVEDRYGNRGDFTYTP